VEAEGKGGGSGRGARLIVLRAPFRHAGSLADAERSVDDDTGRRVAVVERGRVDDRLERRTGLAARLDGAIELACGKAEAAHKRVHPPGMPVPSPHTSPTHTDLPHRHYSAT